MVQKSLQEEFLSVKFDVIQPERATITPGRTMSSAAAKALSLLSYFTERDPEWGLSDLARRAGLDKATVYRMLVVLTGAGLVEQRSDTKLYRLGAEILRLARIRESAFPVATIIEPVLTRLTAETGETAHASLLSGTSLLTIGISESPKATRVSLVAGEVLSLHSTASGIATLAFSPPDLAARVLQGELRRFTDQTLTDAAAIRGRVEQARADGFSEADQTHEDDVHGIAAPLFDSGGLACGAVAVATPTHRITDESRAGIARRVVAAAVEITGKIGGRAPESFAAIAAASPT
jgi:DNA-binding IclR family transcriptional regulator